MKIIHVETFDQEAIKGFEIVHFGTEFCDLKMPTTDELTSAMTICEGMGKELVLVTPYLGCRGINQARELAKIAEKNELAIVINDLGMLNILEEYPKVKKILGRVMLRQLFIPAHTIFKDYNISAIATDNPDLKEEISTMRYYPYRYVSTTRYCPIYCKEGNGCKKECLKYSFNLSYEKGSQTFCMNGNTVFVKINHVPAGEIINNGSLISNTHNSP
jgi:hypothetical protein